MSYYARNPHFAQDNFRDDEDRKAIAEAQAGRWFDSATRPQAAAFNQRMADLAPYKGSPRWDRERASALQTFKDATKDAAALCEEVFAEVMATGEVSEALSYRWDELTVAREMQAAE